MEALAPWIRRTDARHQCPNEDEDDIKDELFLRDLVLSARRVPEHGCAAAHLPQRGSAPQTGEYDNDMKPECCVLCGKKVDTFSYECACCKARAARLPAHLNYQK